jgi:enoyl-CoA hydratase/3-hydroxyacyl-CoA dehydrogenase
VNFQTIGVVGAGNMGAGIAQKLAMEGFAVRLGDADRARAELSKQRVAASLDEAVGRKVIRADAAAASLSRIEPIGDLNDLRGADLVVEAIWEDVLAKKELFRRLDALLPPDVVLGTNTSSFTVHELASATRRPGQVVGLHWFYHPAKNRLLEVIPGPLTRGDVVDASVRFGQAHGKTVIRSKDAPGFVVNRFFVPWLIEAVRLLEEGVADIATIDAAAREAFGAGMGPFALMNATGIPVAWHAARSLGTELGAFYEPPDTLARQVQSGRPWIVDGRPGTARAEIAKRLLAAVLLPAAELVGERVARREDVETGARVGLRWRGGPFQLANEAGVERLREAVADLAEAHGTTVPASLGRGAEPFSLQRVTLDVQDGVGWIRIERPDVLNALDPETVGQLRARFDEALRSSALRGIVLASSGKAFVAGADVAWFVARIDAGEIDRIVSFTADGQALLAKIAAAPVPVVARVHGLALGGGVELALACTRIVASDRASFALPETGIGIYPGLGGTQRLPRRIGLPAARRLIATGRSVSARDALACGLADCVVPLADIDAACIAALDGARATPADDPAVDAAWGDAQVAVWARGDVPGGLGGAAQALAADDARFVSRKAPLALRAALSLLDAGRDLPLEAALALELAGLSAIFSTADARVGLGSVLSREQPVFTGR